MIRPSTPNPPEPSDADRREHRQRLRLSLRLTSSAYAAGLVADGLIVEADDAEHGDAIRALCGRLGDVIDGLGQLAREVHGGPA